MKNANPRDVRRREALRALLERRATHGRTRAVIPLRPEGSPLVLSLPQQRLWFLHQLDSSSSAYNLSTALELSGSLDTAALAQALAQMAARHDALRMSFPLVDGEPAVVVNDATSFDLPLTDLRAVGDADVKLASLLADQSHTPFNLATGPLFRACLVRLDARRHVLSLTVHHIVFDGWSITVFVRELAEGYRAATTGTTAALPALTIGCADYAAWQRDRLARGDFDADVEYWTRQLDDLPLLDLPTDRSRPATATFRGSSRTFKLDAALVDEVHRMARGADATLFMVLAAAFVALLHRYTRQHDIAIGTPVAGRTEPELEGLLGLFANTLVLRTDVSGRPTFRELVARVRRTTLDAAAHQNAPFEHLVERLQPERRLNHQPLFQVAFALQHEGVGELSLPGLELRVLDVPAVAAKFDLTVALTETARGIAGSAEFSSDLFDAATIDRMMAHYARLLHSAVRRPDARIDRLRLLSSEERAAAIARRAGDGEPLELPLLHETFEQRVVERPEATAIACDGASLNYRELNARANRLAHLLRRHGVGPDVQVGLHLDRSPNVVVAILAVLKAGGAYLPLDPVNPPDRVAFILEDAGARVLLTERALCDRLPAMNVPALVIEDLQDALGAEPASNPDVNGPPHRLAYVIYTSGSTGRPKGVQIQHDHVQRLLRATDHWFGFNSDDVWTLFHSYGFDFSVWEIWGALLYGGRLVVLPYLTSRSPDAFLELLSAERVTVLNQTPSAFRQLIAAEDRRSDSLPLALRSVIFGGEALELETLRPWFARHGDERPLLVNMYGITETTVHVTYRPVRLADLDAARGSVIGVPIPDLDVFVLDENLEPVPIGVAGEMYVGGAGVARGYLNRPDLTAERFIPDPFGGVAGARLYRSGDLARRTSDGELEYLGRVDQQMKIRGHRIELGEITNAILALDAVSEAVVLPIDERDGEGQRLVAYVTPAGLSAHDIRGHLNARLPEYMVPSAVVVLDALPLTPHGKLDRRALPPPDAAGAPANGYTPPRTAAERVLADVWAEVLGVDRVGIHDNFFELGGDSIRSIKVLAVARQRGVDVSLQNLFQHQTIAGIAPAQCAPAAVAEVEAFALVTDSERQSVVDAHPDAVDAYPLTRLQQGMLFQSTFRKGTGAYHNVSSFHLRVPFDEDALRRALDGLVSRHPALRSSLHPSGFDRPLQVVRRTVPLPFELHDLRGLGDDEHRAAIDASFDTERARRFDWATAPLFRLVVHRRRDDELQVTLTEHHAIVDGWSVATVLSELMTEYLGNVGMLPPPHMNAPRSTFAQYVAQEQAMVADDEARTFWLRRLEDSVAEPLPPLGRGGISRRPGAIVGEQPVARPTVAALEALARTANVPLRVVLLAAHVRMVALLTAQDDVVTGVVTSARPETADGDRAVGLFLNTVPVRINVRGATWRELVRRIFEAEREAVPYRAFPMAELQRALGRPLFHTAFNYVHFHVYGALARVEGLHVLGQRGAAETELPMAASFARDAADGELRLSLECADPGFDERAVHEVAAMYARTLDVLARSPDARADASAPVDLSQLETWSCALRTSTHRPLAHEQIAAHARRSPNAVAIESDAGCLTYGELEASSTRVAAALRSRGVQPESRVALVSEATPELIAAMVGCWKAGAAFVPIDPAYPAERVRFMLEDAAPAVVLTAADLPGLAAGGGTTELPQSDPDQLAYVVYTSGSTGTPKGVMVPHRGLSNLLAGQVPRFELGPSSRVLQFASLAFDAAMSEIFTTLAAGGTLVLAPRAELRDPARVTERLARAAITTVTLPPALLGAMTWEAPLPALRTIVSAGEACREDIVRLWGTGRRLLNAYGPTETSVCATMTGPLAPGDGTPIGVALENLETWLLDHSLNPVPPGVTGELYVAGDSIARGYLGRPDLTAERFVPHPCSRVPGARLYRTGDLARWRRDGQLEFLGRADSQVKVRGMRVEPGEIEAVLQQHAAVRHAAVVLQGATVESGRLVAYVEHRGTRPAAEDLRQWLTARVPEHAVPPIIVVLDALPLTPSGKIDRRALPRPDESRPDLDVAYVAPRTDLERELAELWAGVLRVDRVGVHDNFFRLGGDSILSLQVVSRGRARGLHFSPQQVFERQTVAELALVTARAGAAAARTRPQGAVPLIPIQHWFLELDVPARHHWNQALLVQTPADLSIPALDTALAAVVAHHDAFRLRLRRESERWLLAFEAAPETAALEHIDLSHIVDHARSARLSEEVEQRQRSLDLSRGPLVRAAWFNLGAGGGRLLLIAHHLVIDGVSWRIVLDDLQQAYAQARAGESIALPPVTSSVQEWARALSTAAGHEDMRRHAALWLRQADIPASPLPWAGNVDRREGAAATMDAWLDADATHSLLHVVPPVYNTRIPDALLTAIVQALSPHAPLRIDMETHGRHAAAVTNATGEPLDLSRTVGWFTAMHPVVIDLAGADGPAPALKQVKEQLRAVPDEGLSYGVLRQYGDSALRRHLEHAPGAAIGFNYLGQLDAALGDPSGFRPADEPAGTMRDPQAQRPHAVDIVSSVEGGRLRMTWIFPDEPSVRAAVEHAAGATMTHLGALVAHCKDPQAGGYTPSDFPQMDFSAEKLETLLDDLDQV